MLYINRNPLIYIKFINKCIEQLLTYFFLIEAWCSSDIFLLYIFGTSSLVSQTCNFNIGIIHCFVLPLSFVNPPAHYCLCFRGVMLTVVEIIYQLPIREALQVRISGEIEKNLIWGALLQNTFFFLLCFFYGYLFMLNLVLCRFQKSKLHHMANAKGHLRPAHGNQRKGLIPNHHNLHLASVVEQFVME